MSARVTIVCLRAVDITHLKKHSLSVFPLTRRGLVAGHTALEVPEILWYLYGSTVELYTNVEGAKDN